MPHFDRYVFSDSRSFDDLDAADGIDYCMLSDGNHKVRPQHTDRITIQSPTDK